MADFKKGDVIISSNDDTIIRAILNSGYVKVEEKAKAEKVEEKPKKGKKGV